MKRQHDSFTAYRWGLARVIGLQQIRQKVICIDSICGIRRQYPVGF